MKRTAVQDKIRDELAKNAMVAIIAKRPHDVVYAGDAYDVNSPYATVARGAYRYADAMLAQREIK